METMTTQPNQEPSKEEKRREYMRKYMKERYNKGGDSARAYNNSLKVKAKHNLTKEDFKEYGLYLADICKIRELKNKLPTEMWVKCILELTEDLTQQKAKL